MVDKNFCMSSYLAFRYIEKDGVDFYEGMKHRNITPIKESDKKIVYTSGEIGDAIAETVSKYKNKKVGVLLSGGMDSAIVASYIPGAEAYTFRFLGGDFQKEELSRAEYYANYYKLHLHYVDISWETVEKYLIPCMKSKSAPVHSIEPQLLQAALQAKNDGVEVLAIGDGSDYIFGGMDKLLSKDWTFEEFKTRYVYTNPADVLITPVDMSYLFERYRKDVEKIDFLKFMDEIATDESFASYYNAFSVAQIEYFDPYANLKMGDKLDLNRVRNGESKYLIRELMHKRYPEIPVPNKNPMPRPVDFYFEKWSGPTRPEFKKNLDMSKFTGNQKWQIWCLENFLELNER